jgi:hypothetical protein
MTKKNIILITTLCICFSLFSCVEPYNQKFGYRVVYEMKKAHEGDTITLRSKKILDWSDFKKTPELHLGMKVHIELTTGFFKEKVSIWTGVITVDSYGGMRRDLSWVDSKYKSQQLLNYLQLKYEIAHYFAKKTEIEINSKKINAGKTNEINEIIYKHLIARDKVIKEIDLESDYGNKPYIIDKWNQKLVEEAL